MSMMEVQELTKSYQQHQAIKGISFDVKPGEIFGLLGPNGAGKSSTIHIITGLIRKDSGRVKIDGLDLDHNLSDCKQRLGLVPQDLAIYSDLSAYQNVRFFGSLYGLRGQTLHEKTEETLAFVGLSDRAKDKAKTFSGGMKRRLNIACGLVHRPKLLILDEPTVGIDPQSRNHILESIHQLHDEGMTIIYTTHYMEEAEQLCDRIAIMDMGQIIAQGTLEELRAVNQSDWRIDMSLQGTIDRAVLRRIEGVADVTGEANQYQIFCNGQKKQLKNIFNLLSQHQVHVEHVATKESTLEDVFLTLTGKSLRQ